ncbi:MAG: WecB/TagA/CpsF family glycosyltransferase [Clostridia bacterium]|jgi:N-acetylglucosaminyldiphosphoundecaprenol N-acetyl-beta-D-mannosaminyltransferase|nr:WecB/TagA/CpsF family glycosyltransferase [Clostridia bacterium]
MRVEILGAQIDGLTMEETLQKIESFIQEGTPHQAITLNAEILYRAVHQPALMEIINQADLVTPDGAGILWAARKLGRPVPERVTGIDLLQEIARKGASAGWKLFLYGGKPGVARQAAANLQKQYPALEIAGTAHGYLTEEEMPSLIEEIREARPQILLVALGAPKQEFWIKENLRKTGVPVAIGVGGSFDVIAGHVKRAPVWAQKAHLEWFYRLVKEPWRYKRMMSLPKFMGLVWRESRKKSSGE